MAAWTRGVEVPEESDLGRARDVLEELYAVPASATARRSSSTTTSACSTGSDGLRLVERPSPNCDERPAWMPIDMLVLHYTGMRTPPRHWTGCAIRPPRSARHYLIDEDGTVVALVPDERGLGTRA